jgi:ketosteroid isomerase-like protein
MFTISTKHKRATRRISRGETAMKRTLMIGSTIAITMIIAASAIRVSATRSDTTEIKALEQRLMDGIKAKDAKQIMSCYSDDVFAYDVVPPREYGGAAAFQKPWQGFLDMFKGPINAEMNDLVINSDGKIAYSRSVQRVSGTTNEGKPFDETFRITGVYLESHGKWVIVQEHISLPPNATRW